MRRYLGDLRSSRKMLNGDDKVSSRRLGSFKFYDFVFYILLKAMRGAKKKE